MLFFSVVSSYQHLCAALSKKGSPMFGKIALVWQWVSSQVQALACAEMGSWEWLKFYWQQFQWLNVKQQPPPSPPQQELLRCWYFPIWEYNSQIWSPLKKELYLYISHWNTNVIFSYRFSSKLKILMLLKTGMFVFQVWMT